MARRDLPGFRGVRRAGALIVLAVLAVVAVIGAVEIGARDAIREGGVLGVVTAVGSRDHGRAAVAGRGATGVGAAATARPQAPTGAPRDVRVVRLAPAGHAPDPTMTPAAVRAAVEGASAYWSEQTRGAISFRLASISDWTDSPHGCEDVAALWTDALKAVPEAGRTRTHLVVVAPRSAGEDGSGCDYGFGSVGAGESGGSTYVTALHPQLLAHELGHNLGLGHAAALECDGAQDGRFAGRTWQEECLVRDYDDLYDVMGYSGEGFGDGSLGAVGIDRLGADPAAIRTVDATTSGLRLQPLARVGSGVRVAKITAPGEPVYYVEYRAATGRDRAIATGEWRVSTGVRILRENPEGGSLVLDTSPGGWRYDRDLSAGQTFVSASGGVRVRVGRVDDDGATIDVDLAGPAARRGEAAVSPAASRS